MIHWLHRYKVYPCVVGWFMLLSTVAQAQRGVNPVPPPIPYQTCVDDTAFYPLWDALSGQKLSPSALASRPIFPLPEILAALQAVPLTQPLQTSDDSDQAEDSDQSDTISDLFTTASNDFSTGDFADGGKALNQIFGDKTQSAQWADAWNLIDVTRTNGNIAPLAAAELAQTSRLITTPTDLLCGPTAPYAALGQSVVNEIPTAGGDFTKEYTPLNWGQGADMVQPGIDYAKHDPVIAASLAMYQSASVDRQQWVGTQNPLWALSLGADGNLQDIPTLNQAMVALRDGSKWPGLTLRARKTIVAILAVDEAKLQLAGGQQAAALRALRLARTTRAVFGDNTPVLVVQAFNSAVNGTTDNFLIARQRTVALDWAVQSSVALNWPIEDNIKPFLVNDLSELYTNPVLHLPPDPQDGFIKLGSLSWLVDDWSGAQLIAFSRHTYVAPQDRRAMVGAAWIRAFVLSNWEDVYAWLPDLEAAYPVLTPEIDLVDSTSSPAKKRHFALLLALHAPGLVDRVIWARPPEYQYGYLAVAGAVRTHDVTVIDSQNASDGNWWCMPNPNPLVDENGIPFNPDDHGIAVVPVFSNYDLSEMPANFALFSEIAPLANEGNGGKELAAVLATSSTHRFLQDTLDWANETPSPEQVTGDEQYLPETLYLAIRATRYGCRRPDDNGTASLAAFNLLHQRYPHSSWTKRTPYWFGPKSTWTYSYSGQ
jgi:hypothetical protein